MGERNEVLPDFLAGDMSCTPRQVSYPALSLSKGGWEASPVAAWFDKLTTRVEAWPLGWDSLLVPALPGPTPPGGSS